MRSPTNLWASAWVKDGVQGTRAGRLACLIADDAPAAAPAAAADDEEENEQQDWAPTFFSCIGSSSPDREVLVAAQVLLLPVPMLPLLPCS